jgi:hypothetical protein
VTGVTGVTGVGRTSGTTYQFVGAPTNFAIHETETRLAYNQVNNLVLVSQGSSAWWCASSSTSRGTPPAPRGPSTRTSNPAAWADRSMRWQSASRVSQAESATAPSTPGIAQSRTAEGHYCSVPVRGGRV